MKFEKVVTTTSGVKWLTVDGIVALAHNETKSAHQAFFKKYVSSGKFTKRQVTVGDQRCWYIKADEVEASLTASTSVADQLS
jgi:hypothetical protein